MSWETAAVNSEQSVARLAPQVTEMVAVMSALGDALALLGPRVAGFAAATRRGVAADLEARAEGGDPFARRSLADAGHPHWVRWMQARRRVE